MTCACQLRDEGPLLGLSPQDSKKNPSASDLGVAGVHCLAARDCPSWGQGHQGRRKQNLLIHIGLDYWLRFQGRVKKRKSFERWDRERYSCFSSTWAFFMLGSGMCPVTCRWHHTVKVKAEGYSCNDWCSSCHSIRPLRMPPPLRGIV